MGEHKLSFDDVAVGDEAPVLTHKLTRTDLVKYAGASGDFNPMHHDEVAAKAAGQPSVFGHGMFSMGLLGTALTDYVGIGNLTRFSVRFARQTWPDEVLSSRIVVTGTRQEGGRKLVDLAVTLSNGEGEQKVVGEATAELPDPGLTGPPGGCPAGSIWPAGPDLIKIVPMTVIKINAITVPEGAGDELAQRFAARAGAVDDQDGFEGFELLRPTDERRQWLVVTRWRDDAAFQSWVSSPAFAHGHAGADRPSPHGGPVSVSSELWSYEVAGGSAPG